MKFRMDSQPNFKKERQNQTNTHISNGRIRHILLRSTKYDEK